MNKNKLEKCVEISEELLERISAYEKEVKERLADGYTAFGSRWNPKLTGAIRRQSMELTRALSDLRKPA